MTCKQMKLQQHCTDIAVISFITYGISFVTVVPGVQDVELAPQAGLPSDTAQPHSMLPARPSAVLMTPGHETEGVVPRDRRPSSSHFYDATEAWMSPVASFSPSGRWAHTAAGWLAGWLAG
jgi:hypothetical protein